MSNLARRFFYPAAAIAAASLVLVSGAQAAQATSTPVPNAIQTFQHAVPDTAAQLGMSDRLSMWYVKSGVIHVGLTAVTAGDEKRLSERLGSNIVVEKQDKWTSAVKYTPAPASAGIVMHPQTARPTTSSFRAPSAAASPAALQAGDYPPFRDFGPPWWGGDRITNFQTINGTNYNIQCTVTAEYGSYMMSAGHCGPSGVLWYQGYYDGTSIQKNGTMGTVQSVQ